MLEKLFLLLALIVQLVCSDVTVNTTSGIIKGITVKALNTSINQFLSIPYAEPPIGALRFAKTVPIKAPKKGIIDGTKLGPSCYQYDDIFKPLINEVSEDCLILNVWSPASTGNVSSALKPVMFWIYGGALKSGSISLPSYNGSVLASYDVVLVAVNYRVGPFGFLYGDEGNAPGDVGFHDQLTALKWVRENIHVFGGDANQITIFGESAGSWSTTAHVFSPLSRGLFKRAILESGAILEGAKAELLTKTTALAEAKQMAKTLNCSVDSNSKWLDCLRKVDAKELNNYKGLDIYPVLETEFLPRSAQQAFKTGNYSQDIDLMAGVMKNEGSILSHIYFNKSDAIKSIEDMKELLENMPIHGFDRQKVIEFYTTGIDTKNATSIKHAFWEFFGDAVITCNTYLFAKQFAKVSPKQGVYFFEWTYPSKIVGPLMGCTKEMGVCHAAEIEHVFGLPVLMGSSDAQFSKDVMKLWTNFAKFGNPVKGSSIQWPRLIDSTGTVSKIKEINPMVPDHIIENLFAKTCDGFWLDYFLPADK